MNIQEAQSLFEIFSFEGLNEKIVRRAAQRMFAMHHVDRGGDPTLHQKITIARDVILQHLKDPPPTMKQGRGGRPKIIDDLLADDSYTAEHVEEFARNLFEMREYGWLYLSKKLRFQTLNRQMVQAHEGRCLYLRPVLLKKEHELLLEPYQIQHWVEVLKAVPTQNVLTIRTVSADACSPKKRSWFLWKESFRIYNSLDFFWTPEGIPPGYRGW